VKALQPAGEIGEVWSCPRPVVYRAVELLTDRGLVRRKGSEESTVGPSRTRLAVTATGRRALDQWLRTPVEHVRDVRSELMLKLLLHHRLQRDPNELIAKQREVFVPVADSLRTRIETARAFDHTLTLWRFTTAEAALSFLDQLAGLTVPTVSH
jgi:DNA-binding PadR family transcriptional regulator